MVALVEQRFEAWVVGVRQAHGRSLPPPAWPGNVGSRSSMPKGVNRGKTSSRFHIRDRSCTGSGSLYASLDTSTSRERLFEARGMLILEASEY